MLLPCRGWRIRTYTNTYARTCAFVHAFVLVRRKTVHNYAKRSCIAIDSMKQFAISNWNAMEYDHVSVKQFAPFLIPRKIFLLPCTYWLFKSIVVRSTAALRLGLSLERWKMEFQAESEFLVDEHREPGRGPMSVLLSSLADVLQNSHSIKKRYRQYNTSLKELPAERVGHFAPGILWSDERCRLRKRPFTEDLLHIHFLDC